MQNYSDYQIKRLMILSAKNYALINKKLDDAVVNIVSILSILFVPGYNLSFPSYAIVKLHLDNCYDKLFRIEKHSLIKHLDIGGNECFFRICYTVDLLPVVISDICCSLIEDSCIETNFKNNPSMVMKIKFENKKNTSKNIVLNKTKIRFYINLPFNLSNVVYEKLFTDLLYLKLKQKCKGNNRTVLLSNEVILPVGFNSEENFLEYPSNVFSGYKIISEFFVYKRKFLFFDIDLSVIKDCDLNAVKEIQFFFSGKSIVLCESISKDSLLINCVPVINFFPFQSEPRSLIKESDYNYIIPLFLFNGISVQFLKDVNVFSIKKTYKCCSISAKKYCFSADDTIYWQEKHINLQKDEGSFRKYFLKFINLPKCDERLYFFATIFCTNSNLPLKIKDENSNFRFVLNCKIVKKISLITAFTKVKENLFTAKADSFMLSYLIAANYSLSDLCNLDINVLKKFLFVHNFSRSTYFYNIINSIESLRVSFGQVRVIRFNTVYFIKCKKITVKISDPFVKDCSRGIFLFGSVLNLFLSQYCALNGCIRLYFVDKGGNVIYKWDPRSWDGNLC